MNYEDARPLIRSGDLLAWSGNGPASLLIRAVTRSVFSHVGIAWWCYGRLWSLEVRELGGGRPPRALSMLAPFYLIPSDAKWTDTVGFTAFTKLEHRYSYTDAIRAALGVSLDPTNGMICSEFARDVLADLGVYGINGTASYTPGGLVAARLGVGATIEHIR